MNSVISKIGDIGIVPVIAISDAEKAVPLAKALADGGIPCAEITFRTSSGKESIKRIAAELPDVILGAGTVLTTKQVDDAIEAGATFIVSPGFNQTVVDYCREKGIPIVPGCATPSDMEKAIESGLDVVKFFPAEQAGGLAYIKAISAPYSMLKFMPTGGINADNLNSYLAFDKIVACGGSFMVPKDLIEKGDFGAITEKCKEAVTKMLGFELKHVGINCKSEDEALAGAKVFDDLFSFKTKNGNSSVFASSFVELMKAPYLGEKGHIAIGVNSVERGMAYLERNGFMFDEKTKKTNDKGILTAVYLKQEILGFAVHLVKK